MPSTMKQEASELRNRAACALLEKIDQNKHRNLTVHERHELLAEVTREKQLKRKLNNGDLIPYDQDRALYGLVVAFRDHRDPARFAEGQKPSVEDVFKQGSTILSSEYLQDIGYHSDRAQEQSLRAGESSSSGRSQLMAGLKGTVVPGVLQHEQSSKKSCT